MPGLNLTRAEAEDRAKLLHVNSYDVDLDLSGEGETFRTKTVIDFDSKEGASTFLDMVAAKVHAVELNGESVSVALYGDNRLPLDGLKKKNRLFVDADFFYMNTGEGMHRSVDPADGKVYLYSQFEVPDARRVYPTFEQPDLKASFTFTVKVPSSWTVFSVSPTPVPELEDGFSTFRFAPTPRISTYITAIVAGPYVGKTATIRSIDGREIDLGVFCRASLGEYLDADRIIQITEQGFGFFENAYGIPYPFTKYDQIFVPEFNAGAMENAGCVTLRDQYIFRSKPTDWQLESRTNTILHELAHMWFGDLVTMKWWDDLWLNESFAEFMAHLATAEATQWADAWVGFMGRKEWGLAQDQKPSTHPIRADMRDLEDVEVNFDGITYAKGASVLRQMVAYVGRENFFQGINAYLTKHAFDNASLQDLLDELEVASGRDMSAWSKVWVEEAGVNLLKPAVEVAEDGTIESLSVIQESFTPGASLRPHRLIVSGYSLNPDGELEQVFTEELDVDGASTPVPQATGLERPDLILVNDQDLAYAKVRLDPASLEFATQNIALVKDALTRRVLMAAAWDMTRDGQMPATQFLDLALRDLQIEDSISAASAILNQVDIAVTSFVAPENRAARLESTAERLQGLAKAAPAGSDQQRLLVQAAARRAFTPRQYDYLQDLLDGKEILEGLEVDVDLRWDLLFALVRGGKAGEQEIAAQLAEDETLTGEQNAARARATVNSAAIRNQTWETIMTESGVPNDTLWAMARGFWSHVSTEPVVYEPFAEGYFDHLVRTWEHHTFQIGSRLAEVMFPSALTGYLPQARVPEKAQAWLEEHPEQPESLHRLVGEQLSDSLRMLAAQACDAAC